MATLTRYRGLDYQELNWVTQQAIDCDNDGPRVRTVANC